MKHQLIESWIPGIIKYFDDPAVLEKQLKEMAQSRKSRAVRNIVAGLFLFFEYVSFNPITYTI